MYSVSHSTENWTVFNVCRPMRIKATTTGLQAAEREIEMDGKKDPERRRLTAREKKKLFVLLLASLAGTDRNRLPY